MNILLTGVTGFIGKHLNKRLQATCVVYYLVRPSTQVSGLDKNHIFVFDNNIIELSVFLRQKKIRGIIHLASLFISQHEIPHIKNIIFTNIYLGTALLEAAVRAEIKWFLNTGTLWQNFDTHSNQYNPVNLYAASKQAFIDMALFYIKTSGIKFCTLKLCDTYGPNDTRKKILALLKKSSITGESINMSPGDQYIDLVYIDDVIDGFLTLMNLLDSTENIELEYKLTSNSLVTLKELSILIEETIHKKLNIIWGGRQYRPREVMKPWQQGTILPGWKPKVTLTEGLKKYFAYE